MNLSRIPKTPLLMACVCAAGSGALLPAALLSEMSASLDTQIASAARTISAFGGGVALAALFLSPLYDRFGGGTMLRIGLLGLAGAAATSAAATSLAMLLLGHALAGLSAGLVLPSSYALATSIALPGREAITLARVVGGWSVVQMGLIPLGALLAGLSSWRVVYAAISAAALVLALLVAAMPRDASTTGILSFPRNLTLLRSRYIALCLVVSAGFNIAFNGTYAFVIESARQAMNAPGFAASLMMLAFGAGFAIAASLGSMVDRIGAARLMVVSLLVHAALYLALPMLITSMPAYLAFGFIWGLTNQYCITCLMVMLARREPGRRGTVIGLNGAFSYTGVMLGPIISGAYFIQSGFGAVTLAACACAAFCALLVAFNRP